MGELLDLLPAVGSGGQTLLHPERAAEAPVAAPEPEPEVVEPEIVEPEPDPWVVAAPAEPEPEAPVAPEPEPEPPVVEEPVAVWEPPAPEPEPEPTPAPEPAPLLATPPPPPAAKAPIPPMEAKARKSALPLVLGLGAVVLLAAAGAWYVLFSGKGPMSSGPGEVRAVAVADQTGAARTALAAALPSVECTWLDVAEVKQQGSGTAVALSGVAGNPTQAQGKIAELLAAKGLTGAEIDMRGVATIEASECGPLDALRQIRDPAGRRIAVQQRQIEMAKQATGNLAGKVGATALIDFDLGDPSQEVSLFGVEPSGKISQLTSERAELAGASSDMGGNRYRLSIDVDHAGWSGLLLLTGAPPFDAALLAGEPGSRTGDWSQRFLAAAKERGWKAEMVWFNAVNEQPD